MLEKKSLVFLAGSSKFLHPTKMFSYIQQKSSEKFRIPNGFIQNIKVYIPVMVCYYWDKEVIMDLRIPLLIPNT
jgi:hypothetical protein